MEVQLGATIFAILVILETASMAQSVHPRNQAEKDACNAAINYNLASNKFDVPLIADAKNLFVIKHSLLFDIEDSESSDKSRVTDSTRQPEEDLRRDLDSLLAFIWNLEMNEVRKLYPTELHTAEVPHLSVQMLPNSGLDAHACPLKESPTTIQISDQLVKRLREESLQQAITEQPGPNPFDTSTKLLREFADFRPLSLTTDDVLNSTEAYEHATSMETIDATGIAFVANSIYLRSLLFVLAHEASHAWFDRCQPPPNETRADDYGLVVSTTWEGAQFRPTAMRALYRSSREKLISQKKQERREARQKLREGVKPQDFLDRADLERMAKLTNEEIVRSVDEELPVPNLEDLIHPLGRLGFETFTLVYEKANITGDDATHPALSVRKAHLQQGYKNETLDGEKILKKIFRGDKPLQVLVEKNQQQKASEYVNSFFDLLEIDGSEHSECEISK